MLLVASLLVGCVPALSTEPKPGQEAALDTIFRELGEGQIHIPIAWNTALDCADGYGFTIEDGRCAGASTVVDTFDRPVYILMADTPDGPRWADLAHEICHWTKRDYDHKGPCNETGELLSRTRAALTSPP